MRSLMVQIVVAITESRERVLSADRGTDRREARDPRRRRRPRRRDRARVRPRARRDRGQGPRLLGAGLAPVPPRQDRDRRRRHDHRAAPRRLHRRPDRSALPAPRPERPVLHGADAARRADRPVSRTSTTGSAARPSSSLGADSTLGRDEFLRLLYGARISFEVALLATFGSISIGVLLGSMAGYFRGWVDTIVSRVTEITMAFPALLFIIALASTVGDSINNITFGGIIGPGVFTLFVVLRGLRLVLPGAHHPRGRPEPAREGVHRGRAHDRLERLADHPLAHPAAPRGADHRLLDPRRWPSFILAEAGLSFLGVGIKQPTASWGNLLQRGARLLHRAAVADGLARAWPS